MENSIWVEPRNITSIDDCYFYHTMDIPGYGIVHGEWDLRGREASYLGNVSLQGKRVLELGTASGYLCFTMEKMGAEVVAYDLSEEQEWDIVPYAGYDYAEQIAERKKHLGRINNGFWLAHKACHSHAKVVYGTVYAIPSSIGRFDVCTFGSILLHLRDPFLALQRVSEHVRETAIVTDMAPAPPDKMQDALVDHRLIRFLPDARTRSPTETWWQLPPGLIAEFLQILGFVHTEVSYHRQRHHGDKEIYLYTVVGRRDAQRP